MYSNITNAIQSSFRGDYFQFYLTQILLIVTISFAYFILNDVPKWVFVFMFLPTYALICSSVVNYIFTVKKIGK